MFSNQFIAGFFLATILEILVKLIRAAIKEHHIKKYGYYLKINNKVYKNKEEAQDAINELYK